MSENIVSTPTHERCVTSYAARTQYKPGTVHPPYIKVKDAIDIHCHAHEGQQDPYDLARRASLAEMKGLLFKSIPGEDPVKATRDVQDDVNRWADKEGVTPITVLGRLCLRQTNGAGIGENRARDDRPRRHGDLAAGLQSRDHAQHRGNLSPCHRRKQCQRLARPPALGQSSHVGTL